MAEIENEVPVALIGELREKLGTLLTTGDIPDYITSDTMLHRFLIGRQFDVA